MQRRVVRASGTDQIGRGTRHGAWCCRAPPCWWPVWRWSAERTRICCSNTPRTPRPRSPPGPLRVSCPGCYSFRFGSFDFLISGGRTAAHGFDSCYSEQRLGWMTAITVVRSDSRSEYPVCKSHSGGRRDRQRRNAPACSWQGARRARCRRVGVHRPPVAAPRRRPPATATHLPRRHGHRRGRRDGAGAGDQPTGPARSPDRAPRIDRLRGVLHGRRVGIDRPCRGADRLGGRPERPDTQEAALAQTDRRCLSTTFVNAQPGRNARQCSVALQLVERSVRRVSR